MKLWEEGTPSDGFPLWRNCQLLRPVYRRIRKLTAQHVTKGTQMTTLDVRNDAEVEPKFISWVGSLRIRFKCRDVGTATYKSDKCDILPRWNDICTYFRQFSAPQPPKDGAENSPSLRGRKFTLRCWGAKSQFNETGNPNFKFQRSDFPF